MIMFKVLKVDCQTNVTYFAMKLNTTCLNIHIGNIKAPSSTLY